MRGDPKVSVIVPVYKVEKYLRRCLDSLVTQTLKDIEIVCVDDGSPDGSAAILEEYAARDRRVVVVRRENGGLSAARNTGMERVTAPYLMFCDSDDWVEPTWCEEMYVAIDGSGADFAICRAKIDGDCPVERRMRLESRQVHCYPQGLRGIEREMFVRLDHAVWIRIFRRKLIDRHTLRFPEGVVCEDWPFCQAYLCASRTVYFLDRQLYHYFQREGSILNGGEKDLRCDLDFLKNWEWLRVFLASRDLWTGWMSMMMEYFVHLVGGVARKHADIRSEVYDLAVSFLEGIAANDVLGFDEEAEMDVRMVRNRTAHWLGSTRWKIGPVAVGKYKCTPWEKKIYILGIRIYRRRFK